VVDVDDAVDHSERMDMSRAAVSSASPRAPSRAWASSVHPSSAKRTARGPEQAATELSRRRRRAGPRARGSGCLPGAGVKAQHGDQLDFGRTPTVPATKCGVLAHRPARRGCRGRPEAVGGREPVSRRRQDWGRTVQRDRAAVCAQEQGLGHFSVGTDGFIVTRPLIWMDQECDDLIGSATRS
jgi:hypothetical protein